ncbi:MAG: Ig-like domain-containing protein, partial [Caldisericaceae bacterium]
MKQRFLSVLVVIAILLSFVLPLGSIVRAAVSVSVINIPTYIPIDCSTSTTTPGNGTPIAVYVKATGGAANTTYRIKSRVGPTTSTLSYAIWWANVSTTPYSWGNDSTAWSSSWPITTDGSGIWSGWIVTKVNTSIASNTNFNWSNNIYYRARLREGSSNRDSQAVSITPLNMTSSGSGTLGGWIEGIAYDTTGTPLQGYPVVVKNSSGTIIGIYLTEDNNVNEGYSATPGYYKVAAPVGSGYTVEVWDPATNTIIGTATQNVWVKAGLTTPNVDINYGNTVVPPTIMQTNPLDGATNVPINTTISVTFDRDMDPSTINTSTFTVKDASNN